MRALATIIAVAMSVTTGGPLRCPCHVAALFQKSVLHDTPAAKPRPAEKSCCQCKAHQDEPESGPAAPKPAPKQPCGHGPGVDLVSPSVGERAAGEWDGGHLPYGRHEILTLAPARPLAAPAVVAEGPSTPPPDLLRYSHAFRC